jgi:hypothetical protein
MTHSVRIQPQDVPFVCNAIMAYAHLVCMSISSPPAQPEGTVSVAPLNEPILPNPTVAKIIAAPTIKPGFTKNGKRLGRPPKALAKKGK